MPVRTVRCRELASSRRTRAPRLGGDREPRHLDLVLIALVAVSATLALAIALVHAVTGAV